MKELIEAINDGLAYFGNNPTEEKQMYVMIDNYYFPIFEAEIVEEDDGTLNLRINGGDGSVTE